MGVDKDMDPLHTHQDEFGLMQVDKSALGSVHEEAAEAHDVKKQALALQKEEHARKRKLKADAVKRGALQLEQDAAPRYSELSKVEHTQVGMLADLDIEDLHT